MNSLDTNVVLRFLLNDIQPQSLKARKVLSNPPVYVSDVVVTETVFVLEKSLGYGRKYVASLIRVLMQVPGLIYSEHLLPNVVEMYDSNKSLSFVDCYSATEAKVFGSKLYTFDRKLISQGGAHVKAP